MKKFSTGLLLLTALSSTTAMAGNVVVGGYIGQMSGDSGFNTDITLTPLIGAVGYNIPLQNNFSVTPEFLLGLGLAGDTVNNVSGTGINVDYDLEHFISVGSKLHYHINDKFNVFGALALAKAKYKATASTDGISASATGSSDTEFGFGVGVGYEVVPQLTLEGRFSTIDDVDLLSAGLVYHIK